MPAILKRLLRGQRGQALPAVLALMALGGLIIAPGLNYSTAALKSTAILSEGTRGIYAAEAGIEYSLWSIKKGLAPPLQTPERINNLDVSIATENLGVFTLYLGELVPAAEHTDYLTVNSSITWDAGEGAWQVDISAHRTDEADQTTIHIEAIGMRLPVGYHYVAGSAYDFSTNLSRDEPDIVQDDWDADMLNWTFDIPYPKIDNANPVRHQKFYITGTGDLEGDYTWVVANRTDVGVVGEFTGALYQIRSTATRQPDGKAAAVLVVDVLDQEGVLHILQWQILK